MYIDDSIIRVHNKVHICANCRKIVDVNAEQQAPQDWPLWDPSCAGLQRGHRVICPGTLHPVGKIWLIEAIAVCQWTDGIGKVWTGGPDGLPCQRLFVSPKTRHPPCPLCPNLPLYFLLGSKRRRRWSSYVENQNCIEWSRFALFKWSVICSTMAFTRIFYTTGNILIGL